MDQPPPDYGGAYWRWDNITLTAVPNEGFVFQNWTGDIDGIADPTRPVVNFIMGTDRTITANFTASSARYAVTTSSVPSGAGSVTLSPDQADYLANRTISVSATANHGYAFSHWAGDLGGDNSTARLRIDGSKSIIAFFNAMLVLQQNVALAGTVDATPAWTPDGYAAGTVVTLSAAPAIGYIFARWTGDVEGIPDVRQNSVNVDMNSARTITAEFAGPIAFKVSASADEAGGGSVLIQPAQPIDGYLANEEIQAYASPAAGYAFDHWTGDAGGASSVITLRVDGEKTITAVFHPKVTVQCEPVEGGTVQLSPVEPSSAYVPGAVVTAVANPAKGYRFSSWAGDLSGSEKSVTVTVDAPTTIDAVFVKQTSLSVWPWVVVGVAALATVLGVGFLVHRRLNGEHRSRPA